MPIEFKSRNLSATKIQSIKEKLLNIDWNGMLNSEDCNINFDRFCDIIKKTMDQEAPIKTVRISTKRCFIELWMTTGLETTISKNKKLYKETLKSSCNQETIKRYKKSRNLLNRLKQNAMQTYYRTKYLNYKNNTEKLWQIINQTISKCKHSDSIIPCITKDGIRMHNPKQIANKFGNFYVSLGANLVGKITPGARSIEHYMQKLPRYLNSMVLTRTSQREIKRKIDGLPNKSSCGHDKISNILLKQLKCCISYPLMVIFNQLISSGIFRDKMKIVEIIPLYKGKEKNEVVNYRPISLLMTISKLLEKKIYARTYNYLEQNHILYDSQYGFRSKRSCDQAIAELTGRVLQAHEASLHSAALFLNLSKAFDTLNHEVLLAKSMESEE